MNLRDFDKQLRELWQRLGYHGPPKKDARPFLCEGSPLKCELFIVGLNPQSRTSFWESWDASYGFDLKNWVEKDSKIPRRKTRDYLDIIRKELHGIKFLETNIYTVCSNRFRDLPKEDRRSDVLRFLLESIRPRWLFVHGHRAVKHLAKESGMFTLALNKWNSVPGIKPSVYAHRHLSYQLSKQDCRQLGRMLLGRCLSS
jgi:uracil-DNA glycosylase